MFPAQTLRTLKDPPITSKRRSGDYQAAYEAGLRTGDVIIELNHQPVKSAQDAVADTEKQTGGETLVKVWTKGGSHYLIVDESRQG
jgi:S1-C subfamily serine protease